MANYNLDVETTAHIKGFSFGGFSETHGGRITIDVQKDKIGVYRRDEQTEPFYVIDTDESFVMIPFNDGYNVNGVSSVVFMMALATLVADDDEPSKDVMRLLGGLGYAGMSEQFFAKYINGFVHDSDVMIMSDTIFSCNNSSIKGTIVSRDMFIPTLSVLYALEGLPDISTPFDEIMDDVSDEMSKIQWNDSSDFVHRLFAVAPSMSKTGMIDLYRGVLDMIGKSGFSQMRSLSMFRRSV